jgi:BCCT family betaine/carnitine transporter
MMNNGVLHNQNGLKADKTIFIGAILLLLPFSIPLLIWPLESAVYLNNIKDFIVGNFGVAYIWLAISTLGFVLWLAFSKYGNINFGNTTPQFSTFSWASMLFCAGVATGILYWGSIEWAYYYDSPPFGAEPRSLQAIEWSSSYGMFHWGITGWAFYALPTVAIGYAYYVRKIPQMRISTACHGLIGRRSKGFLGKLMDIFFMAGLLGSTGTSLGLGTPMIAAGLVLLFGFESSFLLQVIVIIFSTIIFATSVYLGLEKGIKKLSNINTTLALLFLLFVLLAGPTLFILKMATNSFGFLIENFIRMSTWTEPLGNSNFVEDWSIFYWAWWIAVGPFMGIFVAKISKGRTIRQIVIGSLIFGSLGSAVYYAVLGNYALSLELNNLIPITEMVQDGKAAEAIVSIVSYLPMGKFILGLFCIVAIIFIATSFDSSSYTLASCATVELDINKEPMRWQRLFWAFALILLPIGLMLVGGLDSLKTAALISSMPLLFVYVMMGASLLLSFKKNGTKTTVVDEDL